MNESTLREPRPGDPDPDRLRVLYVTNGFPYPLTSGLLRHYYLLREIARRHAVTLLSIVGSNFTPEHGDALASFTDTIVTFPRTDPHGSRAHRGLARIRPFVPSMHAQTPAGRLAQTAAKITEDRGCDVVLFTGKGTHPALDALAELPVVVDMCDTSSTRVRGQLRFARKRQAPKLVFEYFEMRWVEGLLAKRASHLLFASARDRDALLGRYPELGDRTPITLLPNGVDLEYWHRTNRQLGGAEIVFTGAMDWPPNEDAALHLARDVMPLVWRALPDARLSIVGRSAGPALRAVATDARVTVTGFVPDVRPYLERAAVFVAPLRFGAGIQNKVLEAMAMEVPAIASPSAAAGVRSPDGRDPPLTIATEPQDFAVAIVDRLVAAESSPLPDEAARQYVEEHFTWHRSGDLLGRALESATRAGASGGER